MESARGDPLAEQRVESGLPKRRAPVAQGLDSRGVGIHPDDTVSDLREARRGHTAEMPETGDGDPQGRVRHGTRSSADDLP